MEIPRHTEVQTVAESRRHPCPVPTTATAQVQSIRNARDDKK